MYVFSFYCCLSLEEQTWRDGATRLDHQLPQVHARDLLWNDLPVGKGIRSQRPCSKEYSRLPVQSVQGQTYYLT